MRNEQFVDEYIKSLEKSDGIALDIGANHGIYTALLADKFETVHAFEPHPVNVEVVSKVVENKSNVVVEQKVVGYTDGYISLFINEYNHGGHTIMEDLADHGKWGHSDGNVIVVDSVTLDTFCADKTINFIKCDIEGGEYEIFFYGDETLKNNDLTIVLETHQVADFETDQADRDHLQKHFESFGYTVYGTDGNPVSKMSYDTHYVVKRG